MNITKYGLTDKSEVIFTLWLPVSKFTFTETEWAYIQCFGGNLSFAYTYYESILTGAKVELTVRLEYIKYVLSYLSRNESNIMKIQIEKNDKMYWNTMSWKSFKILIKKLIYNKKRS